MADNWQQHVLNNVLPRMEANRAAFEPAPANPQPFSAGLSFQPPFDLIELLPPAAADKLRALRQRASDAHTLIPPFEDVRQASMARVDAANALKRLTDHPQDFGSGLKPSDPRVIAAQRTLDKATADFERIQQRSETKTAAWHAASGGLANAEAWLPDGRPHGVTLQDHETEPPKLAKGENGLLDAIEARRRRCRELCADQHRIRCAPYPSSHCKARAKEQIEALAMQGAPTVSALIEHDGDLIWPQACLRSEVRGGEHPALAFAEVPDTIALFAWLHRDLLIKRLDAEIDTESDDASALTHEARQQAEAEVMGDLLDIERQEAALTWQAQAQGLPCEHRSDINPLALLAVRLVTAPRADGLPPTSPGHAITFAGERR